MPPQSKFWILYEVGVATAVSKESCPSVPTAVATTLIPKGKQQLLPGLAGLWHRQEAAQWWPCSCPAKCCLYFLHAKGTPVKHVTFLRGAPCILLVWKDAMVTERASQDLNFLSCLEIRCMAMGRNWDATVMLARKHIRWIRFTTLTNTTRL